MLTHIVFFKVPDADDAERLVEALRGLPDRIEGLDRYEAGVDVSRGPKSLDVALYSTFPDADALERYRVHPAHQEVLQLAEELSDDRVVVDFET